MLNWLRNRITRSRVHSVDFSDEDWVTVPFRYAEAARVSLHTIQSNPAVPPDVRNWIGEWLGAYNSFMAGYMQETYGHAIFPLLDQITKDVMPKDFWNDSSWEMWERELSGDE